MISPIAKATLLVAGGALLWVGARGLGTLHATPHSLLADLPAEVEPGWALIEVALGGDRQVLAAGLTDRLSEWFEDRLAEAGSSRAGEPSEERVEPFADWVGTGRRSALGARSARFHVRLGAGAAPAVDGALLEDLVHVVLEHLAGGGSGAVEARWVGCALREEEDGAKATARCVDWSWLGASGAWGVEELPQVPGWQPSRLLY